MRRMLFSIGFVSVLFAVSCATQEQVSDKANLAADSSVAMAAEKPVAPGPLSSTLNAYYKVKDAFTRTDGTGADMAAMQLRLSIDSLDAGKMKMDSAYTAVINNSRKAMLAAVDGIIKERDMQRKRMQFATLSDSLYSLVKTTPYKGQTVYRLHCPMAFDKGADWLSNEAVIANPYFGSKMMECGEVTDSLVGK